MQKEKGGQSSHDYIYSEILLRLSCRPSDLKKYKEHFESLRKHRVKADYSAETFDIEDCLTCKENAEGLIVLLRTNFKSKIA